MIGRNYLQCYLLSVSDDVKTGEDSKFSHYRLSDNYLRFYLKYVKKILKK